MIEIKDKILFKCLEYLNENNWQASYNKVISDKNFEYQEYCELLFPNQTHDIVLYYLDKINLDLEKEINSEELLKLKVRERIIYLIKTKLNLEIVTQNYIQKTISYLMMPNHIKDALEVLSESSNQMWILADDKSNDFSFYTKRFSLSVIYTKTLLYWIYDKSNNYNNSWNFLDKQISMLLGFGKIINKITKKY